MTHKNLEIVHVKSAAIVALIWDHSTNQMIVKFKESPLYVYPKAPRSLFDAFVAAPSKGRFFQQNVKNQYSNFVRLDN